MILILKSTIILQLSIICRLSIRKKGWKKFTKTSKKLEKKKYLPKSQTFINKDSIILLIKLYLRFSIDCCLLLLHQFSL